jgi:hypothetical protein
MKSLLFLSACGLVLTGLSACAPVMSPTARVALDCPTEVGDLTLSSAAPDKKTCLYSTRQGDQVSLRLIPVSGSYEATLQPIEAELQGEVVTDQQAAADKVAGAKADVKAASGSTATAAAQAAKQAAEDALRDAGRAKADDESDSANKVVVDAGDGHGDHTSINLPGIHISADDDKARVNVGGVHVDAGENGATVRMSRDVRLRGEALSPERRGFRATYILARDDLKDGWKSVGYEAAGPKTGPIVVAVFKAHEGAHHDVSDDVKRLVRRNGGV